jgi:hypothetical protein
MENPPVIQVVKKFPVLHEAEWLDYSTDSPKELHYKVVL